MREVESIDPQKWALYASQSAADHLVFSDASTLPMPKYMIYDAEIEAAPGALAVVLEDKVRNPWLSHRARKSRAKDPILSVRRHPLFSRQTYIRNAELLSSAVCLLFSN